MTSLLIVFFGFAIYSLLFFLWPEEEHLEQSSAKISCQKPCQKLIPKNLVTKNRFQSFPKKIRQSWLKKSKLARQIYLMLAIKMFAIVFIYFTFFNHNLNRQERQNSFSRRIFSTTF